MIYNYKYTFLLIQIKEILTYIFVWLTRTEKVLIIIVDFYTIISTIIIIVVVKYLLLRSI